MSMTIQQPMHDNWHVSYCKHNASIWVLYVLYRTCSWNIEASLYALEWNILMNYENKLAALIKVLSSPSRSVETKLKKCLIVKSYWSNTYTTKVQYKKPHYGLFKDVVWSKINVTVQGCVAYSIYNPVCVFVLVWFIHATSLHLSSPVFFIHCLGY